MGGGQPRGWCKRCAVNLVFPMLPSTKLSKREWEVTNLVWAGNGNKQIAAALSISERTVEFHLKNIYKKFQVSSRVGLILKLGSTTGRPEAEKLGLSTVDTVGQIAEDGDQLNSRKGWATALREAVSIIGKELRMESFLNASARSQANPTTFFGAIRVCLAKYGEFNGRAARPEFWWFALFVMLINAGLAYFSEALVGAFSIAMLLPFLAVGTRRLHDTGRSGWWQLYWLVPVAGIFIVGEVMALPSIRTDTTDTVVE